jgi:hypothetical protein
MRERAFGEAGAPHLSLSTRNIAHRGPTCITLQQTLECISNRPCMATNSHQTRIGIFVLPHHPVSQYMATQRPATGQRDPSAMPVETRMTHVTISDSVLNDTASAARRRPRVHTTTQNGGCSFCMMTAAHKSHNHTSALTSHACC